MDRKTTHIRIGKDTKFLLVKHKPKEVTFDTFLKKLINKKNI